MVYAQLSICPGEWDTQNPFRFWDADHLISTRRPDLVIVNRNKRTCRIVDFAVPADHRVKLIENEKKNKYLDLARKLKKKQTMQHEGDDNSNYNLCAGYSHQRIGTVTWGLGNGGTSGDHPNKSIVEIDQNTEKSPGDLRGFAVS